MRRDLDMVAARRARVAASLRARSRSPARERRDSHPISIKHGSAMVLLYFNRGNRKWEGAGKKFITLNSIPPADGNTYPFRFEGTCFPNTREKIHLYVESSWPTGPDNVDRYVPRVGSFATKGCGQARGQAGGR